MKNNKNRRIKMIKEAINKLVNGEDLSYETVEKVMNENSGLVCLIV